MNNIVNNILNEYPHASNTDIFNAYSAWQIKFMTVPPVPIVATEILLSSVLRRFWSTNIIEKQKKKLNLLDIISF